MNDYFELFDLISDFIIDKQRLEKNYQSLLSQYHPDKFINATEIEKIQSLSKTATINTAYQTLKDDLKRASYLLELAGINAFDEKNTQMNADFLMTQIELQEQLENLEQQQDIKGLEDYADKIDALNAQYVAMITQGFLDKDLDKIKNLVRELKFYQQLKKQSNALMDEY